MNLIERFGYDAASRMSMSEIGLKKDMEKLQQDLLEYRRQNNIFEVGDRIVIDGKYDKTFMPVLTILDEGKNYYYCDDGQVHKHLINQWRHATPEEIAAGKRL